jgi:formiminotetrahydrofolate cyclodeaminase
MTRLAEQSITQLYRDAGSTEPAPGGGSVTALCGMLGIALVLKALRISLKRREDGASFQGADTALEQLSAALAADADADAATFSGYIAAMRLPKGSREEAARRAGAIQDAAVASTQAGLEALEHAARAIAQAKALGPAISQQMAPDLEAGLALLALMRLNAVHNAEANLTGVKDEQVRDGLARRLEALEGR